MIRFRPTRRHSLALALALGVLAAAPPVSADADSRLKVFGYARSAPVDTVPDSIIDDWKYLDDRNVMVFRSGQAYLLALSGSCPALQSAGVIGFNAALSGLVATKTLMVGSGSSASECGVDQIVQLQRSGVFPAPAPAPAPRAPARAPAPRAPAAAPAPAPSPVPAPAPEAAPAPAPAPAPAAPTDEPPPTSTMPPPRPRIDRPVATPPGATPL